MIVLKVQMSYLKILGFSLRILMYLLMLRWMYSIELVMKYYLLRMVLLRIFLTSINNSPLSADLRILFKVKVVNKLANKGTTKYLSNKQEKSVATDFSGKVVIASGALWGSKGDVITDLFLIECKTTGKPSYSLNCEKTWMKIHREASIQGLLPLMVISANGKAYVVSDNTFLPDYFESYAGKIEYAFKCKCKSTRVPHIGNKPYSVLFDNLTKLYVYPYDLFLDFFRENQDELIKLWRC